MSKKNFTGGIDSLFQNSKTESKNVISEKVEIKTPSYSRTTIIVNNETYENIKAIAYWERKPIKDVIEMAFNALLSNYPVDEQEKIIVVFKNH